MKQIFELGVIEFGEDRGKIYLEQYRDTDEVLLVQADLIGTPSLLGILHEGLTSYDLFRNFMMAIYREAPSEANAFLRAKFDSESASYNEIIYLPIQYYKITPESLDEITTDEITKATIIK